MWFWRRFFSFSVLTVSFGLGLGLGLEPLWTRTWLGLEPLWTWTWLGLEPLWTWTCLGLDKGGLDYSPTSDTIRLLVFLSIHLSIRIPSPNSLSGGVFSPNNCPIISQPPSVMPACWPVTVLSVEHRLILFIYFLPMPPSFCEWLW